MHALGGNHSLHHNGGVVYFSVLEDLKEVVDESVEGCSAGYISHEGGSLEEAEGELFELDELRHEFSSVEDDLVGRRLIGVDVLELRAVMSKIRGVVNGCHGIFMDLGSFSGLLLIVR